MSSIVDYYSARAAEYEDVYARPERQDELRQLKAFVASFFAGRNVLEVACGTGYWTRLIAPRAGTVTALDLSAQVLELARARQRASPPVNFVRGDAFALDDVRGDFDAALAGFWISHIPRLDVRRFLDGLHRRLQPGSRLLLMDNRYVVGMRPTR